VLTGGKHVGCLQDTVYQDPSHLHNSTKKFLRFEHVTLSHHVNCLCTEMTNFILIQFAVLKGVGQGGRGRTEGGPGANRGWAGAGDFHKICTGARELASKHSALLPHSLLICYVRFSLTRPLLPFRPLTAPSLQSRRTAFSVSYEIFKYCLYKIRDLFLSLSDHKPRLKWPVTKEMIGCVETTVTNCQSTVHNVPDHRRSLIIGNEMDWACGTSDINTDKELGSGNLRQNI